MSKPKTEPTNKVQTNPQSEALKKFEVAMTHYEKTNFKKLLQNSPLTPERFVQVAISNLKKNPKMVEAFISNPFAYYGAIFSCAEFGLSPSQETGEAYFIPYKNEIKFIIGYKGLAKLIMGSGAVKNIWAECVYDCDEFEYELGLTPKLKHVPKDGLRNNSTLKYIYCCAKMNDGEVLFKVMSKNEILAIRNLAKFPNDLFFSDKDPQNWMAKKSVFNQLAKFLPKDWKTEKAMEIETKIQNGGKMVFEDGEYEIVDEPKSNSPIDKLKMLAGEDEPQESLLDEVYEKEPQNEEPITPSESLFK